MQSAPARGRRRLAVVVAALALAAFAVTLPAPARASVETSLEASLKGWLNHDRATHGLRALRTDARLQDLAGARASWMASNGLLTHNSVDGSACSAMTSRSIYWYACGEDIGWATGWSTTTAKYIYTLWRHSPGHWALMMSSHYNYVGIGVARRSNGTTYASLVFLEGPDRTPPIARMKSKTVSGRNVTFTWSGSDPHLQTHTAGLKSYNIEYRVDGGAYVQIRTGTTKTSIHLLNRPRGHWYTIRVQARDRRGNLSAWSHGLRAWVP
jgi:uncharacterized protein YkwD